jgi:hypothetical protein
VRDFQLPERFCLSFFLSFFLMVMGFWEIPAGMKVYETNENEMILEPSLKFAGNPNIIVAVKAFGVKATVQVT